MKISDDSTFPGEVAFNREIIHQHETHADER